MWPVALLHARIQTNTHTHKMPFILQKLTFGVEAHNENATFKHSKLYFMRCCVFFDTNKKEIKLNIYFWIRFEILNREIYIKS